MPSSDLTITIQDGSLSQVPASVAGASVKLGICSDGTPNVIYTAGDTAGAIAQLGQGPMVEDLVDTLNTAGAPVYAVPLTPSTPGTVGSVTHTGPGTGTVTPSRAPAKTIDIKVSTGGTLGTAQIQIRLNGGAYAAPVLTTGGSFVYAVPGTLTTITIAAGTYVADDVYTISTTGVISLVGTGPAASNVTQVSSPLDGYDILVIITTTGGLGAGVFTYSVDGGNNTSAPVLVPSGGKFALPSTGVVLTFSGTFTDDDTYRFSTVTAAFSNSDVTAGLTALLGSAIEWGFFHVVGMGANAAAAASLASACDTQTSLAETNFRYVFGVIECPTTEADSALAAAFSTFSSVRIVVCAGDIGHQSSIVKGRVIRRNCAVVVTSRIAKINPGEDPAWVGRGVLPNVKSLYPNGGSTTWTHTLLDAQRFTVLRQHQGESGYYVAGSNTMAPGGSDFNSIPRRRVMDVACRIVRKGMLPRLNQSMRVNDTGTIDERDAKSIEGKQKAQLNAGLVSTGDASAASVVVSRTEPILSTSRLPVDVRVLPLGYAKFITVTIGFENPAIAA